MEYNFQEIEARWQKEWAEKKNYHVEVDANKPKFYVLNMFPYPSGAGLHVGHPLGYIASDIYARYKRQQGYNVLNPMGYDAYGLPAEQYAIQTGQHPEKTTTENIARYRQQLDRIGFSFDWDREIRTCDPEYYHWTQWAFQKMFGSYYCINCQKAKPIERLIAHFEEHGTEGTEGVACSEELTFTAAEWKAMSETEQQQVLMNYRIAYLGETMVNWCPKLGTVLANDEVVNGVSERGGYPVEQKKMRQWCLRVSAYSQRLLDGLDTVQWSESIKETQRNWIGRSEGTEVRIAVANDNENENDNDNAFTIFTTRADTMFGVTFFVLAPESELVKQVTTAEQQQAVDEYLAYVAKRTERERQIDHTVTGVFSGSYGINPITGERCPIYISEYVLAGYGTGAIMAVPAHDSRDYAFAKHFGLPIIPLIEGADVSEESYDAKEGIVMNSPVTGKEAYKGFSLNGLTVKEAIAATKKFVTEQGLGRVKVNYRLRDAIFSRQRYWGEPFPVYYKDGMPRMIPEECLPIELPEVSDFKPTETGEPPLGNAACWAWDTEKRQIVANELIDNKTVFPLELSTMPGFAGSSAYYLRYMDPRNHESLVGTEADGYWQQVDLYVGGSEHATGHLIYSRFWNKFLFDLGVSQKEEPFQKLINQGMIQGWSSFVWRVKNTNTFVSYDMREGYDCDPLHADISLVSGNTLDVEAFRQWRPEYRDAEFILNPQGQYIVSQAIEKMSKSKYNVVNPDDICARYGADTLRLYEMFLGPIEQSKPWDVAGIDGCFRFLKRAWGLCAGVIGQQTTDNGQQTTDNGQRTTDDVKPTAENLKTLHKLIKKVTEDIEAFSYNTSVPAFMVAATELQQQKCRSREVLEQFITLLAPFCPHFAEELWHLYGHTTTVCDAPWPTWNEEYLRESSVTLGVQFNGKVRFSMAFAADATPDQMQQQVLSSADAQKYLEGMQIVKVVAVPKRIVNVVVKPQ